MVFSDHFRGAFLINKNTLELDCKKADGGWVHRKINLDTVLGNSDGKFHLNPKAPGSAAFSQTCGPDVTLQDGVLTTKLKRKNGAFVDARIDLGLYFESNDIGAFVKTSPRPPTPGQSPGPALDASTSMRFGLTSSLSESVTSGTSASAGNTTITETSSSSSSSSSQGAVITSSSSFSSSKLKFYNQELSIDSEESCTNFSLQGTWLLCDIKNDSGIVHAKIDLDLHISGNDGRLVWDGQGFSKTCTDIRLEDMWFLVAKCHNPLNKDQFLTSRLDLRTRIRVKNSNLIFLEANRDFSMMLTEVPWMKFKVFAEPDFAVFSSNPVIRRTMTGIAESTVDYVSHYMQAKIEQMMAEAMREMSILAMQHVATIMERNMQGAADFASANMSATGAELLRIQAAGFFGASSGGWASWSRGSSGSSASMMVTETYQSNGIMVSS